MNAYVVSTECPSCAAPLDFSEGTNAVQCLHCHSKLLVTGRKKVLSYFVSPAVDHNRAIASAMRAQQEQDRERRVIKPKLYFIPYYRLTGNDFRWERHPVSRLSKILYTVSRRARIMTIIGSMKIRK
jgi:LSD1 subclass zinc finger protein